MYELFFALSLLRKLKAVKQAAEFGARIATANNKLDILLDNDDWYMDEVIRNSMGYGWEIGHGAKFAEQVPATPTNPFLDHNWQELHNIHFTDTWREELPDA